MRKIIGITPCHYDKDGLTLTAVWRPFIDIIEREGGSVLMIPAGISKESFDFYINQIDALLIPGGPDVYPPNFSMSIHEKSGPFDLDRDDIELMALKAGLERNLPILGICRGAQLMNLYFGGTLHQDLDDEGYKNHNQWTQPEKFNHVHHVNIKENTILSELGMKRLSVNSGHHQGIHTLGQNLKVNAVSYDGLIEGFEHVSRPFVVGLQWHPEVIQHKGLGQAFIFRRFMACIKKD